VAATKKIKISWSGYETKAQFDFHVRCREFWAFSGFNIRLNVCSMRSSIVMMPNFLAVSGRALPMSLAFLTSP